MMAGTWNIPTIHIKQKDVPFWGLPREKINDNFKWIKHVDCSGSRSHVIRYSLINNEVVVNCSELDCIFNASTEDYKKLFGEGQ